jgi:hypothetical protein
MPPTYRAKMSKTDWGASKLDIGAKLSKLGVAATAEIKQKLGSLTFGECDDFATELVNAKSQKAAVALLKGHWNRCTLEMHVAKARVNTEEKTTWAERCKMEATHNR